MFTYWSICWIASALSSPCVTLTSCVSYPPCFRDETTFIFFPAGRSWKVCADSNVGMCVTAISCRQLQARFHVVSRVCNWLCTSERQCVCVFLVKSLETKARGGACGLGVVAAEVIDAAPSPSDRIPSCALVSVSGFIVAGSFSVMSLMLTAMAMWSGGWR